MKEIGDGMNWRDELTVDLHEYIQSFLYLLIPWKKRSNKYFKTEIEFYFKN